MTDGFAGSPDYRAAIAALAARTTHGVRLGLDRTRALLERCGNPHLRLRAFHVAGTNGKGSTCATLDAVLQQMGFTVGRYSSPHLIDFRERLLINGVAVDEAQVMAWLGTHHSDIDQLGATFFEATTAMAFDLLSAAGVDVAVIEVGLGGRLDSTNVVTPLVAAVTSIGLDHREYLGDTVAEIAVEKAGIFNGYLEDLVYTPKFLKAAQSAASTREILDVILTSIQDRSWRVRFCIVAGLESIAAASGETVARCARLPGIVV